MVLKHQNWSPTRQSLGNFGCGLHSQSLDWYWQKKRYNRKIQAKYNSNKANNAKLPWFSDFLRHSARKRDYNALAPTCGNAKTHIKSADGRNIILKSYQNSIKSWRTTATLNMTENCNTSVIVQSCCHKLRPSITITQAPETDILRHAQLLTWFYFLHLRVKLLQQQSKTPVSAKQPA